MDGLKGSIVLKINFSLKKKPTLDDCFLISGSSSQAFPVLIPSLDTQSSEYLLTMHSGSVIPHIVPSTSVGVWGPNSMLSLSSFC